MDLDIDGADEATEPARPSVSAEGEQFPLVCFKLLNQNPNMFKTSAQDKHLEF